MRRITFVFLFIALVVTPHLAAAHSYKAGDIYVGHIWAKPTAMKDAAIVNVAILNRGSARMWITGLSTDIARQAFIAAPQKDGAILNVNSYPLPGKKAKVFQEGLMRPHFRLVGLTRDLKEGDKFPLTIHFGDRTSITVEVFVETNGKAHKVMVP